MQNKKLSVLYVDDESLNLKIFELNFKKDFLVYTATSGKEALEILEREHDTISVIITDQKMPEMTGVELLKVICEQFPQIPPSRLIISGFSESEVIDEAYENYKLYKFISKPWNREQLLQIIHDSLDNANYSY